MGLMDTVKGLLKGREKQVKSGIDTVSDQVEKRAGKHAGTVDDISDKAKDAVDKLAGSADGAPPAAAPAATPPAAESTATPPGTRTRRRRPAEPQPATRRPEPGRDGGAHAGAPLRHRVAATCRTDRSVAGELVLHLVDALLDLAGGLVDLALALHVLVVGEIADGLLDPALGLIAFTTHGRSFRRGRRPATCSATARGRGAVNVGCSRIAADPRDDRPRRRSPPTGGCAGVARSP